MPRRVRTPGGAKFYGQNVGEVIRTDPGVSWSDFFKARAREVVPGIKLDVSENSSGNIVLSRIVIPEDIRGQGVGDMVMTELIALADSMGKTITLTPTADFGGDKGRLEKWYGRHGFVRNRGRDKDYEISEGMYRRPGKPIPEDDEPDAMPEPAQRDLRAGEARRQDGRKTSKKYRDAIDAWYQAEEEDAEAIGEQIRNTFGFDPMEHESDLTLYNEYGDATGDDPDVHDAAASFIAVGPWADSYNDARTMRLAAYEMVGYDAGGIDPHVGHRDVDRYGGGGWERGLQDRAITAAAYVLMEGIASAPPGEKELWRGTDLHGATPYDFQVGERLVLPLASFADNQAEAQDYGTDLLIRVESGAKGVRGMVLSNGGTPGVVREVVSGGEFEVVSVVDDRGSRIVTIRQVGVYNPATGELIESTQTKQGPKLARMPVIPAYAKYFDRQFIRVVDESEEKAIRRVRTPAGAAHYGQAIGEIIREDEDILAMPTEAVRSQEGRELSGGRVAQTRVFTTPEGQRGVSKVMTDDNIMGLSARHMADAEYLTSLVARAVGALAPTVYQVDSFDDDDLDDIDLDRIDDPDYAPGQDRTEIWMNFVPDAVIPNATGNPEYHPIEFRYRPEETGRDRWVVLDWHQGRREVSREFNERWQAAEEAVRLREAERRRRSDAEDDDGRLLGLLDLIVYNSDRNGGNWLLVVDGEEVRKVGIDHGGAFADVPEEPGKQAPIGAGFMGGVGWPRVVGWFSEHFYAERERDDLTGATRKLADSNDMSPGDMKLIERALEDLAREFSALGRMRWYEAMMTRFEMLKERAKGTRDRLTDQEAKALRRVRTAEGAEHYGQPIGTIIQADLTRLAEDVMAGVSTPRQLSGGQMATVTRHTLPDGSEVIAKDYNDSDGVYTAEHHRDAEYLASLVAGAVGARVPAALIDESSGTVWMPVVDGTIAVEHFQHRLVENDVYRVDPQGGGLYKLRSDRFGLIKDGLLYEEAKKLQADFTQREWRRKGDTTNDDGLLLGLLDLLIANPDRHKGNWFVVTDEDEGEDEEDDLIVGIDHGNAWGDLDSTGAYDPTELAMRESHSPTGVVWPKVEGWFSLPFLGEPIPGTDGYRIAEYTANPMSPHDMDLIRRGLESIKPEFERRGRLDWWDDMMRRFEVLYTNADGDRDRLEG